MLSGALCVAALAACAGTPESVKALSAAQLKNTGAYCADVERSSSALAEYFTRYRDAKLEDFKKRHERNKADTLTLLSKQAKDESWDATQTAAKVASAVSALELQFAKDNTDLTARIESLKLALGGLVTRCQKLVQGQTKLDDYAQLQKSDDAVNHMAAETLGVDTEALRQKVDVLAEKVPKL
jgi:hypothetical protein